MRPYIIYENDERYQLDATIVIYYHKLSLHVSGIYMPIFRSTGTGVLIIYDSTLTSLTNIQRYMDTIHSNIKLKPTDETNDNVNFLDLLITRQPTSLELDIYRKPTATDTTINFLSNHPFEQKLAAYKFFINRMLSLPLNDVQRHREWKNIKLTAHNNKIPIQLLTKLRRSI
jgi:hypothetical protein